MKTQNPFITPEDRIVGGRGGITIPWHIYIQREDPDKQGSAVICGGTMINTKLVITARHCFGGSNRDKELKGEELNNAFIVAGLSGDMKLLEGIPNVFLLRYFRTEYQLKIQHIYQCESLHPRRISIYVRI